MGHHLSAGFRLGLRCGDAGAVFENGARSAWSATGGRGDFSSGEGPANGRLAFGRNHLESPSKAGFAKDEVKTSIRQEANGLNLSLLACLEPMVKMK